MTTLITGGAGFIGGALAARLIEAGERIVILDNFDPYYAPSLKRARIARMQAQAGDRLSVIEGDLTDETALAQVFRHEIRRVAHLASLAGVRFSIEHAARYAHVNTTGSVMLMDAARKHGVEQIVMASTSSVYGEAARVPFREEDAPDQPLAPYPASKRAAELFAHSFHHLFGTPITVLRFFNVYGPDGRPDMMPVRALRHMLKGEPIPVYAEGKLQRDWTYIDDTIDGVIAALGRPLGYALINLGYGAPTSLTAFIDIYERLTGLRAIREFVPAPASEPTITYCDNTLARELLGFAPKIGLEDGLARTWAWYQQAGQP
ncbi:SDR family NAD(P)-dependent oxidoreductase [Anaerolineae bacterium CFX9]|nr:SDR family NAD(P)-dependent oxidoreductase [Kamptonema cortianum]MDL1901767.1 SDR family NAD(P)-dependent oxidoreductase [Anaerolineae bacterium CFX9]